MSDSKKPEINTTALGYAEKIRSHVTMDKETAVVSDKKGESTAYLATLPESLTPTHVADVRAHDQAFVQGATIVTHEMALSLMAENKDIERVKGVFDMGNQVRQTTTVERQREFTPPNRDGQPSEKIVHHGFTTTEVRNSAISGKAWKDIQHALSDNAKSILGSM